MERKITDDLLKWKRDSNKKPLVLYGSKGVGKTYSVLDFGEHKYKNVVYFDCTNNLELFEIFAKEKTLDKIILKLSMLSSESIFYEDTLIVFDNCSNAEFIKALKIFSKDEKKYDVIIITSRRDILNKIKGEEFRYLSMYGMDFEEFLLNSDKKQLIDFIKDSYQTLKPMPFHQMAMDIFHDYLITGGYPEVVNAYLDGVSSYKLEAIKKKIYDIYVSDIMINNNEVDATRAMDVWYSLPYQLIKDNRKFQYGVIKKGARSKDYENSINMLAANLIVNRSFKLNDIKSPLNTVKDAESFKLYANDSGLLFTMLHLNKVKMLMDDDIRRLIVENNVANVLVNMQNSLYYYQSDGKAEVTFVVQDRLGKIIPIEVVNMKLTKAKSLSLFLSKFNIEDAIRITEDNFSKRKGIRYIPTYATFCLKDL